METDEGEKEVPAKKPKTEPVLVRPSLDFSTLTVKSQCYLIKECGIFLLWLAVGNY